MFQNYNQNNDASNIENKNIETEKTKQITISATTKELTVMKGNCRTLEKAEEKEFEKSFNPNIFIMNTKMKNKKNAHLFDMDISEFLSTTKEKPKYNKTSTTSTTSTSVLPSNNENNETNETNINTIQRL